MVKLLKLLVKIKSYIKLNHLSQMKIRFILMAVIALAISKVNSQMQLPVIHFNMDEFMANQQHMQDHERQHQMQMNDHQMHDHQIQMNEQGRAAEISDPVVGFPLLPLSPLHPFHPLNPLGLGGVPGLRFNKFSVGKFGNTMYSNSILGAENPMAEDDSLMHHHHHHIDSQLASPQHYQMEQNYQIDHELAAPQPQVEFNPFHHWHFANPNDEVGEPIPLPFDDMQHHMMPHGFDPMQMPQQFELAAPPMQQIEMFPAGPPMQHMQIEIPNMNHAEEEARTFWSKGDDYGYG